MLETKKLLAFNGISWNSSCFYSFHIFEMAKYVESTRRCFVALTRGQFSFFWYNVLFSNFLLDANIWKYTIITNFDYSDESKLDYFIFQ